MDAGTSSPAEERAGSGGCSPRRSDGTGRQPSLCWRRPEQSVGESEQTLWDAECPATDRPPGKGEAGLSNA